MEAPHTKPGAHLMTKRTGPSSTRVRPLSSRRACAPTFASAGQKPKAKRVAARIDGFDFFVIATQLRPLFLESSPVLRHKPKYARLKDDKGCPP